MAVAWVSFVLAMVALYVLARLDLPPPAAQRAVLLAAVFPFSFFFGAAYSESTFLLFSLLAFYFFRTRRWLGGGLCGAFATATRVPGILILPALALVAWTTAGSPGRERARAAAGVALAAAGCGAYCLYIYFLTGNPLAWISTLERWGYHPGGPPWTAPLTLIGRLARHPYAFLTTDPAAPYDTLYGVTGVLFLVCVPFVWVRLGAAYGLFVLLSLGLPLSSGEFEGMGRYCSVLFPCFIWLATIESTTLFACLAVGFALFYTLGLSLFTTLHPLF